uniref:F-box domain-containing protein n=1 Tax=Romanomermis culicivorax TaxID=13658 RepID=A0A915HYF2_ROMCU
MDQDIILALVFPHLDYKDLSVMEKVNRQFYGHVIQVYKSRSTFDTKNLNLRSFPGLALLKLNRLFYNLEKLYLHTLRFKAVDLSVLANLKHLGTLIFDLVSIDDAILFSQFLQSMAPQFEILDLNIDKFDIHIDTPHDFHIALENAQKMKSLSLRGEYCPRFLPHERSLKNLKSLIIKILSYPRCIQNLTKFFLWNSQLECIELLAFRMFRAYIDLAVTPIEKLKSLKISNFDLNPIYVVGKCRHLKELVIGNITYVHEDFFKILNLHLGGTLERLEICIKGTNFLPIKLDNLVKLTFLRIEQLYLSCFSKLASSKLENLRVLNLVNTKIENDGMDFTNNFPNLKSLKCGFSDWKQFYDICHSNSESLQNLELRFTKLDRKTANGDSISSYYYVTSPINHANLSTLKLYDLGDNFECLGYFKRNLNLRKTCLSLVKYENISEIVSNLISFIKSMEYLVDIRINNPLFQILRDDARIKSALSTKNIVFLPED